MKLLTLATLLLSTQIFASECPKLSGDYLCTSGSRVSEKMITQANEGYLINSDGVEFNYLTDGKIYDVEATSDMKDGKILSTCRANKFVVNFNATILYEGSAIAKQSTVSEYALLDRDMTIVQKTKMKGIPLPAVTFLCKRI